MTTRPINNSSTATTNPALKSARTDATGTLTGAKRIDRSEVGDQVGEAATPLGGVDVNLSPAAREKAQAYQKALDIARKTPDIREDRVAEMKKKIQDGNYKIDSGKIADGMLMEAIRDKVAED
jgi:flagellar biosynthesis anti-sigma factor FlgM